MKFGNGMAEWTGWWTVPQEIQGWNRGASFPGVDIMTFVLPALKTKFLNFCNSE